MKAAENDTDWGRTVPTIAQRPAPCAVPGWGRLPELGDAEHGRPLLYLFFLCVCSKALTRCCWQNLAGGQCLPAGN